MSDLKQQAKSDEKHNIKQDVIESKEANEEPIEKDKETEQPTWTPVWDDNAQAYYWWNTETNETTWINPDAPAEAYTEGAEPTAATTTTTAAAAAATTTTATTTTATTTTATSNNPLDFLLDRIDNVVKKKLDGHEDSTPELQDTYYNSPATYDQYFDPTTSSSDLYASQAHFNARTGRFTTQSDVNRLNPEMLSIEARATRQMQNYFDVDSYTEQRNAQLHMAENGRINKKKPLTRKEVEYFKKMKKEKKSKRAREWLMQ